MFIDFCREVLLDALKDTAILLVFLYPTYLLMEYLEHKTGEKAKVAIGKAGKFGPAAGGLLGVIPSCGFSAAAAGLYSGGVITVGTLVAVFLSTSDEMFSVMIAGIAGGHSNVLKLLTVLGIKVVVGITIGFIVDLLAGRHRFSGGADDDHNICDMCEQDHCHCGEHSIFVSALFHTLKITAFIFAITIALNAVKFLVGEENIGALFRNIPVAGEFIAGLVGLIPNCAASVFVTELYLDGILNAGQLLAGLFVGAGVGFLILFRTNRNLKENLTILSIVYLSGTALGILFQYTGLAALLGL